LKEWGKPDTIKTASESEETWIYERSLWCGVIPVFILPVPLLLPVCDGYDRIDFRGNEARRLHTRRIVMMGGVIIIMGGGTGATDPACRHPIPIPLSQKIQPGKTVSLSVSIDTQEHQEEEDYREASTRIRDSLAAELVTGGIFNAVVPSAEPADYVVDVTITSANISRKKLWGLMVRPNYVHMTVRVTNRDTNQMIGDFEIKQPSRPSPASSDPDIEYTIQRAVKIIVLTLKD
jgi:hypothetical protein